ncbi:hypothetical protein PR202_ga28634 [Eleusine coracana subsp. coracana]|uniref:Flavin-containing monooxygenase n=1 Tax=Eleusine coracana subsp. coracana TaxID=191504 RepID=A0AAV5DJA0_ELECO|nr:hypothetical protein PR202_ga28634 [Eleusine coracana subsp. coracana]
MKRKASGPACVRGDVVVVVGGHESGKDISAMSPWTCTSASSPSPTALPRAVSRHHNLHLHPQIERRGRSHLAADSMIYCTGYRYSFPFLDAGGRYSIPRPPLVGS